MEFNKFSSNNKIVSLDSKTESPNIMRNLSPLLQSIMNKIAILLHYNNYICHRLNCNIQKILLVKSDELHKLTKHVFQSHMFVWLKKICLNKDPIVLINIPYVFAIFTLDIIESFRKKTVFLYQTILLLTFPILIYRVNNQISVSTGSQYLPSIIWSDKPVFSLPNEDFSTKIVTNQIIYIKNLEEILNKTQRDHSLLEEIKDLKDYQIMSASPHIKLYSNINLKDEKRTEISLVNSNKHHLSLKTTKYDINNKNIDSQRVIDMLKNIYLAQRFSISNIGTQIKDEWKVLDTSVSSSSNKIADSNKFFYKQNNQSLWLLQSNNIFSCINNLYVTYIKPYQFNSYFYDIYEHINDTKDHNQALAKTNNLYSNTIHDQSIKQSSINRKTAENQEKHLVEQYIEINEIPVITYHPFNALNITKKVVKNIQQIQVSLLQLCENQVKFIRIIAKWLSQRHRHLPYINSSIQSNEKLSAPNIQIDNFLELLDSERNKWRYQTAEWIQLYHSNKTKNLSPDQEHISHKKLLKNKVIQPNAIDFWHYNKIAIINPLIRYFRHSNQIDKNELLIAKNHYQPYFWSAIQYPFINDFLYIRKLNLQNNARYENDDIINPLTYSQVKNNTDFIQYKNILNILTKSHFSPQEFVIRSFVHTTIKEKDSYNNCLSSLPIKGKYKNRAISHEIQQNNFLLKLTKLSEKINQTITTNTAIVFQNDISSDIIQYLFKLINETNKKNSVYKNKLLYDLSNINVVKNSYNKKLYSHRQESIYDSIAAESINKILKDKKTILVNNLNFSLEPINFSSLYTKFSDPFLTLPISLLKTESIVNYDLKSCNPDIFLNSLKNYDGPDKILSNVDKYINSNNELETKRKELDNRKTQVQKNIIEKYNKWILTTQWWNFRTKFICNEIPIWQIYISDQSKTLLRPILEKINNYYYNVQKNLQDNFVLYYNKNRVFSQLQNSNKYIVQELYEGTQSISPTWETLGLYNRLDSKDLVIFGWFITVCILYYHWIPLLTGLTYINIWYKFEKMYSFSHPSWDKMIRILVHNSIDSVSQQIRLKMYASRGWMIWLQSQIWSYFLEKTFFSNYLLHTRSIDVPRRKKNLVVNSLISQKSLLINYTLSNSNQSIYSNYGSLGQSQHYEGLIFLKKWSQIFYRNPYFSKYQKSVSSEFQWLTDLFFQITSKDDLFAKYNQFHLFNTIKVPKKLPETTISTKRWLLIGAPETGKSYLVKNIAADGHFPLVHISLKDIRHATPDLKYNKLKKYNKWIKQLADRGFLLDNILELAKMLSPCILWISDLHEFHGKHSIRHQQGKIYDASLLLTILLKIMGNDLLPERQSNITLVGSSHSPRLLDPKFVSRHRLDLIVNLRKPSFIQRQKIFANLLDVNNLHIQGTRAFYELGSHSIGYTLRDITGLVNEILLIQTTKNTKVIDTDAIRLAIYRQISKQSANNTLVEHDALQYKIGRALVQSTLVVPKPIFPITLRHDLWKTRFYYLSNAFLEFTIEKSTVTELLTLRHIVNCLAGSAAQDAFILFSTQISVSKLGITKQLKHDLSIASSILQALFLEFPMRDITSMKKSNQNNILGDIRGKYNLTILEKTASSLNFFNRFTSYIYWSYRIQRLSLSWTILFDNIIKNNKHMILESSSDDPQSSNDAAVVDQYIDRHLPYERRVIKRQQKRTKKINYSFHEMVIDAQLKNMGLPWVSEYIIDYDALNLSILLLETRPIWNPPALNPSYSILFFDRDLVISRNMLTKVYITYGEKFQSEKLNPKRIKKQVLWPDATIHNGSMHEKTMKQEDNVQVDLPDFSNFRKMAKANAQLEQSQLQVPVYLYQGWTGLDHQDSLQYHDLLNHRSLLINKELRDRELLIYGTLLDIYHFLLKFFIQHHSLLLTIENKLIHQGILNREDIEKMVHDTTLQ